MIEPRLHLDETFPALSHNRKGKAAVKADFDFSREGAKKCPKPKDHC
jgi:hypothetical protein